MKHLIILTAFLAIACLPQFAAAEIKLSDVCRIKGQEENTLHGMGLVVGLKGTGDGDSRTTMRALARYMELMGHRIGNDPKGQLMLDELKGVKNVAMVFLTVTVPAGGAQQGDLLDCKVSAMSAKSIEGVSTTTTGFIGAAAYGPVALEPDIITSLTIERIVTSSAVQDIVPDFTDIG